MDCVFCKIIAGEIKSFKIYEDDQILAFMDRYPVREGQTLVIPKKHIDHFSDLPDDLATKIFLKAHHISKNIRKKLNPERTGLVVHGYGVPHAHLVIVPQHDENDITASQMAIIEDGKIIFTADKLLMATDENLDKISKIIKNGL